MIYLLLANLYMVIFYAFYHFVLRNQTFFRMNRYYLMTSVGFAFLLPIINIATLGQYGWPLLQPLFHSTEMSSPIYSFLLTPIDISSSSTVRTIDTITTKGNYSLLTWMYFTGCLIAFVFFLYRLRYTFLAFMKPNENHAFSFFNRICIDSKIVGFEDIMLHEKVHIKEWHSLDIMIIHILKIFNWFNPIIYLYERSIKLQHEFHADELASGNNQANYAQLLLATALDSTPQTLNNQFNQKSLLKPRIVMLLKQKTPKQNWNRIFLILPLLIGMVSLSSAYQFENQTRQVSPDIMIESTIDQRDTIPFVQFNSLEIHPMPHHEEYKSITEFRQWIGKNYILPQEAIKADLDGKLEVSFIIDDQGNVRNTEIVTDLGYGTGEALQALIEKSTWVPGILNGKAVSTKFTLPLRINTTIKK